MPNKWTMLVWTFYVVVSLPAKALLAVGRHFKTVVDIPRHGLFGGLKLDFAEKASRRPATWRKCLVRGKLKLALSEAQGAGMPQEYVAAVKAALESWEQEDTCSICEAPMGPRDTPPICSSCGSSCDWREVSAYVNKLVNKPPPPSDERGGDMLYGWAGRNR